MSELPFDRVQISEDGRLQRLTVAEFLGTPLAKRIQWILGRHLEFFWGTKPIERRQALQALRAQKMG